MIISNILTHWRLVPGILGLESMGNACYSKFKSSSTGSRKGQDFKCMCLAERVPSKTMHAFESFSRAPDARSAIRHPRFAANGFVHPSFYSRVSHVHTSARYLFSSLSLAISWRTSKSLCPVFSFRISFQQSSTFLAMFLASLQETR